MWLLPLCVPMTYRVVDSPHEDSEEGFTGSKELHLLTYEVLLLGFGFTGAECGRRRRTAVGCHGSGIGGGRCRGMYEL